MALLMMDGFDYMGNGNSLDLWGPGKWLDAGASTPTTNNGLSRTGTYSIRFLNSSVAVITKIFTPSGGAIVGVAIQATLSSTWAAADFLQIREGTTVHIAVAMTAGGLVQIKRGTTVLATGSTVLSLASWYYIELKTVINDTTGSYEVRIDGVTELSDAVEDTQNGGTGLWDRVYIAGATTGSYMHMDDFYVCDTSGSAPQNTFLGPVKVELLMPSTGNGSNVGLTPSTGTDHGALVDEVGQNATDYNSSATVGLKDTYNYPSMTLTGTIYGVETNMWAAKSDTTTRQVCAVVRAGGVDYDGANVLLLTSFKYFAEIRSINPNTGVAWTVSDIASLEAGMKVTV